MSVAPALPASSIVASSVMAADPYARPTPSKASVNPDCGPVPKRHERDAKMRAPTGVEACWHGRRGRC